MRRSMLALGLLFLGSAAFAQDRVAAPAPGQEMPMPKPGPEHEVLRKDVGVWDATIELTMEPGGKPEVTRGTATNTMVGGFWLVEDFQGEMFGKPFHGHSITGWDASRKKYVGTWVDSMSPGFSAVVGTVDPKTHAMHATVEGPSPQGGAMKMRSTTEWKGDGTRVFTMFSPEGQGEEFAMMKITYKRRAAK
ncbi:DUF1579 family protein [Tundrisphaera sp. TA3]|uniref:DUF1579 domain-containing protein n=1 Tax=Tundrisphaera sp. TA3 TaxID=3435775 RepID=UPI003EBE60A7